MTQIIEEGLPRESRLVEKISVRDLIRELDREDKLVYIWTPTELGLLENYSPSTYHKVSGEMGLPVENRLDRKKRLALQVQSEISNRASTVDVGITHERRDEGSVRSKIYQVNRLGSLYHLLGLPSPAKMDESIVHNGYNLTDILIEVKLRFAELLRNLPSYSEPVSNVVKVSKELDTAQREKFRYVDELTSLLGRDLVAVAAYGSSTRESNPNRINDYDNYAVVAENSLERVLDKVRGRNFRHPVDGKHVGLNIVSARDFPLFNRINHDPGEIREQGLVLHGELELPVPGESEVLERGTSYAVLRAKMLKSMGPRVGAGLIALLGKRHLHEYMQKTQRFVLQSALNSKEGLARRDKEALDLRLRELNGRIMPYHPNEDYLFKMTCWASASATRLLEHFYAGKKFNAPFMKVD